MQNKIIINADDFGKTESCSKAIAAAFEQNLISSTTAMANGVYIEKAFELAEKGGFKDKVGIHIVLTEGVPLTEDIKNDPFFCENGVFHGRINRLKKPTKDEISHLESEIIAQIKRLRDIGFTLSHADSHHHIHTDVFFIKVIKKVLKENGVNKIRSHRNFGQIRFYKKIVKDIFNGKLKSGGFLTTEKMGSFKDARDFPETLKKHLTEIMVHPDFDKSGVLIDRTDWASEFPIGYPLEKIKDYTDGLQFISYNGLK